VFSLEIESEPESRDLLIAELWDEGCCGIAEPEGHAVRAFFEDSVDRAALLARYPGSSIRIEEDRDWVQAARDLLQPMEVGRRFFLVPEWRDDPAPAGRLRITINPGMAFGTGVHETTRLCIEALEDFLKPGMKVLDVGTGSGILRAAAQLLGAGKAYACDVDPIAVSIAGNAFVGSVDAVRSGSVDLAIANISPEGIIALAPELLRALNPAGVLLVSGFDGNEVDQIRAVLPQPAEVRLKGNWALIAMQREVMEPHVLDMRHKPKDNKTG
jgi:ribosomal protein L11 methyltransferase